MMRKRKVKRDDSLGDSNVEDGLGVIGRVIAREGGVDQYAVGGSGSINFVVEFCVLEGELGFGEKW